MCVWRGGESSSKDFIAENKINLEASTFSLVSRAKKRLNNSGNGKRQNPNIRGEQQKVAIEAALD